MPSFRFSRLTYWGIAHAWSIVRCRRRIVFMALALGLTTAAACTFAATWIYTARVTIHVNGLDRNGVATNDPSLFAPEVF